MEVIDEVLGKYGQRHLDVRRQHHRDAFRLSIEIKSPVVQINT